jgi:iron complex transport system substrate-binding protein
MASRRLMTLVAAVALLTASSCGDSSTEGDPSPASPGGSASTRTVESTFTGQTVTIPAEPQRVVALWRTGSELVDLGIKPVAQLDGEILEEELGPELYAEHKDIPTVGTFEGVDVEKVIAAEPDLIVGMDNGGLSIDYAELAEIAPTVILKIAEPTDVWDNYPTIADLMARSTDFTAREKGLDDRLAAIKMAHGEALSRLEVTSLGAYAEGEVYVDTAKSLTFRRLDAAGFGYNPVYNDNPARYAQELPAEQIASLGEQDAIFYDVGIDGKPNPATQKLIDSPSFQRLAAARAGHVYPLTSGTIFTFAAADQQIDDLQAIAADLTKTGS